MSYFDTPAKDLINKLANLSTLLSQVHKVLPNGFAAQEGSIHEGDQVLSINGTALHNSTHKEALQTMRNAKGRGMAVVVIRRGDVTETCYGLKDSPQKAAGKPGVLQYCIYLYNNRSSEPYNIEAIIIITYNSYFWDICD